MRKGEEGVGCLETTDLRWIYERFAVGESILGEPGRKEERITLVRAITMLSDFVVSLGVDLRNL